MGQFTLNSNSKHIINMARFLVLALCVAMSSAAPTHHVAALPAVAPAGYAGLAHAGLAHHGVVGYSAGPTHVHETVHAGPAVAKTHVQHGIVGHKTVPAGTRTIQTGHQYVEAGSHLTQAPAYSLVHAPATNEVVTKNPPVPAVPVPAPAAAIPPAPVNLGPAPADTVTVERVMAPTRTHQIITPQATRIEPELHVQKYTVEVPVAVPTPVEREVIVNKHVPKPYNVEVPTSVAVPQPYPAHQVKKIIETPVIQKQTYTVSHPVATTQVVGHAVAGHALATGYAGLNLATPLATGYTGLLAGHGLAAPALVKAE